MKAKVEKTEPLWIRNGIVLGGMYEGLMFPRRRGEFSGVRLHHNYADAADRFRNSFSPDFADTLKNAGITMMILNFHKGLGWEAERGERELMRIFSGYCHERGIGVGVYIGDTFFPETFFLEHPEAEDWCCRDPFGNPLFYDGQPFRRLGCLNNPGWLAYLHGVTRHAVIEYGADLIHYDNFMLRRNFCHCRYCTEKFRGWLLRRFSGEERCELFGFSSVEQIFPPPGLQSDLSDADPLVMAYRRFRIDSLSGALQFLSGAVRQWNPDCLVELNCRALSVPGLAEHGADHDVLLRNADVFWDEASPFPRYHSAVSRIRTFRLAEARHAQTLTYNTLTDLHPPMDDSDDRLLLGEAMTFGNSCLGSIFFVYFADQCRISADAQRYIAFFHRHAAAFHRKKRQTAAALYYGKTAQLLDFKYFDSMKKSVETALQQGHVSWKMVFDDDIAALPSDITLIVACERFMSGEVRCRILDFVRRGGHLILCGENGAMDEWRRHSPVSLNSELERFDHGTVQQCLPERIADFLPRTALAPASLWVEPVETEAGEVVHLLNYDPGTPAEIHLEHYAGKAVLLCPGQDPREIDPGNFSFDGVYGLVVLNQICNMEWL